MKLINCQKVNNHVYDNNRSQPSTSNNNKAEGAPNTKYSSSDISIADGIRVSRILWEKIWNKEIFIAFGDNPYRAQYKDDTRFFINM